MNGRSAGGASGALVGLAVNQPREQLLAGAAFAEDQDGGRQARHLLDDVEHFAHRAAGSGDELAIAELLDFGAQGQDAAVEVLPLATHAPPLRAACRVRRSLLR